MMATINKFGLLLAFFSVTSFALPTVHYQKTLSASVGGGGGAYSGSSGDVAVDFSGAGAAGAAAGAFATAHASASAGATGAATIEKEITYGHKNIPQRTEVIAEKTFTEAPKVVSEHTIQGQAQVQRTVIEKTVIPQYVEKTIQVPSYVEKTIRVPTVVEHKVRVPVTPKVVEKTYEENGHAGAAAHAHAHVSAGGNVQLQERPAVYATKQFGIRTNSAGSASGAAYAGSNTYSGDSQANLQVKSYNSGPGLLGNILNIPIATLGAVGNLFTPGYGNAGASVSFNKNYRTY